MDDHTIISNQSVIESKIDRLLDLLESKTRREYLTVKETADLLRCSTSCIRDRMRNGALPFKRLGESVSSQVLIARIDIDRIIK
ncbi:MAG: helix-turn-helix domain-containing protein [Candidatus Marinimicrobia bacterium]|nr:helix-turn-helix domain-containing protein [Candidatus Neomarinimicrobiota bacterium]